MRSHMRFGVAVGRYTQEGSCPSRAASLNSLTTRPVWDGSTCKRPGILWVSLSHHSLKSEVSWFGSCRAAPRGRWKILGC